MELLIGMLIAIILGSFRQSARVVIGLKKESDRAGNSGGPLTIDTKRLMISLLIGAMAGLAAFMSIWFSGSGGFDIHDGTKVFSMVTAGYAGTDFIEAFMKKHGASS